MKHTKPEITGGEPISPPRLSSFLLGTCTPRELEKEVVEDFETVYQTWAYPKYGRYLAPAWAYLQAPKALLAVVRAAVIDFWGRSRKRAQ